MSVSAPASAANLFIRETPSGPVRGFQQRTPQLVWLNQALSAGDLSAAQSAFSAFQQDFHAVTHAQNGQSSVQGALQALGQALSSGNLSAAQSAFATLQQDIQNAGQAHHHHHRQGGSGQASTNSMAPTSTFSVKA